MLPQQSNTGNEFSTGCEKALDAKSHWRHTVRASGAGPLAARELTRKDDMTNIQLLNIDQVCATLNMGRVKVYELINRGRIKSIKIGARRLVSVRALHNFIDQLEEGYGAPR